MVPMSICPDKDVRCHTFLVKVALLVCGWKAWKSICRVKRLDRRSIYGYNSLPRKGEKPNAKVIATFTNGVVGAPSQPYYVGNENGGDGVEARRRQGRAGSTNQANIALFISRHRACSIF